METSWIGMPPEVLPILVDTARCVSTITSGIGTFCAITSPATTTPATVPAIMSFLSMTTPIDDKPSSLSVNQCWAGVIGRNSGENETANTAATSVLTGTLAYSSGSVAGAQSA